MIFKRANFNDTLALLLGVVVIPAMWILTSLKIVAVPDIVTGATISIETLIAQFYFRKAKDETPSGE